TAFTSCTDYPNTASVSVTNEDGGPFTSTASTTVQCPSLGIAKTADASPVDVSDPVGFKVTISNGGPGAATDVTVDDPLPSGTGVDWSIDTQPAQGSCTITGAAGNQTLTCSLGTLESGASVFVHVSSGTSFDPNADYTQT